MDFYKELELDRSATSEEIRVAYKKMSLKYHPDKPGGSTERFQKIQRAHSILGNPEKKNIYDSSGRDPDEILPSRTEFHHMSGMNANNIFAQFFGSMDSSGGSGFMPNSRREPDIKLACTYDELIYGCTKKISHKEGA